jgi:hypothetical protein
MEKPDGLSDSSVEGQSAGTSWKLVEDKDEQDVVDNETSNFVQPQYAVYAVYAVYAL